jgi:hypothetical protein
MNVDYILEMEDESGLRRATVIPFVNRHSVQIRAATSRKWTLGKRPIKEKRGYRQFRIEMSGAVP